MRVCVYVFACLCVSRRRCSDYIEFNLLCFVCLFVFSLCLFVVSHDNGGAGAGWHLARVDVVPLENGAPKAGMNAHSRRSLSLKSSLYVLNVSVQAR